MDGSQTAAAIAEEVPRDRHVVVEAVAGTGVKGYAEGPLSTCAFNKPTALCRYGDSLFVADDGNYAIRMVEGVLGVADPLANSKVTGAEFEARAVPLIMTAIPVLPKELARLTAQYAHVFGRTRIIAGTPGTIGSADGSALSEAGFVLVAPVAVDVTDPVAGPQLIIGGNRVGCLNLRTEMVTTIAGPVPGHTGPFHGYADGPASSALFDCVWDIAVAPNGALFVAERDNGAVRRISDAKWQASGAAAAAPARAQRRVTTLIGKAGPDVQFARSAAESFRRELSAPAALALYAPAAPLSSSANAKTGPGPGIGIEGAADADADRDVGCLYVGGGHGGRLHVFDLTQGVRKRWQVPVTVIRSLAVTEDGARLFALSPENAHVLDTDGQDHCADPHPRPRSRSRWTCHCLCLCHER
jgi:hypothetical protein